MKRIFGAMVLISGLSTGPALANPYEVCMPFVERAVTTNYQVQSSNARTAARDALVKSREQQSGRTSSGGGELGINLFNAIGASLSGSGDSSHSSSLISKYSRNSSLDLSDEDYLFLLTTVEHPAVAKAAEDCIRAVGLNQGSFRYTVNDVLADDFSITYIYVPQAVTDPEFVAVNNLSVVGGAQKVDPEVVGQGTRLEQFAGYTQHFRRTHGEQSALVQLDVSGKQPLSINVPAKKKYDPLPIGMVIASPLAWGQFSALSGDSPAFDAKKNRWAPCDGRSVAGSALATGGEGITPDLRGVFVRGLNDFAAGSVSPVASDRADPEAGRRAGDYQADELKEHSHSLPYKRHGLKNGSGNINLESGTPNVQSGKAGGAETRPKNVALYYYVKIN